MARVSDFAGIKGLIRPLEESGVFIQRTDEEVFATDKIYLTLKLELFRVLCNLETNFYYYFK